MPREWIYYVVPLRIVPTSELDQSIIIEHQSDGVCDHLALDGLEIGLAPVVSTRQPWRGPVPPRVLVRDGIEWERHTWTRPWEPDVLTVEAPAELQDSPSAGAPTDSEGAE